MTKIANLTNVLTAADITNDANIRFGLDNTGDSLSYQLSLAELKKTGVAVVNVLQKGADPTGVASSTVAFDNAFDDATDGVVYVPPGEYDLATWTTYTLTSRSLTVVLDPGAVITGSGSNDFIACGTNGILKLSGGRITEFRYGILCASSTTGGTVCELVGVEIDNCVRGIIDIGSNSGEYRSFVVERCYVHDIDEIAIGNRMLSIEHCVIRHNVVKSIGGTAAAAHGILVGNNTPNSSTHCVIDGNYVEDVSATIAAEVKGILCYANHARIVNNTVVDIDVASGTDGEGIYGKIVYGVIANNMLINAGEGGEGMLTCKGGRADGNGFQTIIQGNHIVANRSSSTANTGIYVSIDDALIRNNTVECTGSGSIYRGIALAGDGNSVVDNVIRNLNYSSGAIIGISLANFSDTTISDNWLEGFVASSGTCNGIQITSSASGITNVAVQRNTIKNLTGGSADIGISIIHSATISPLIITDNYIESVSKAIDLGATYSATASDVVISRNHIKNMDRDLVEVTAIWLRGVHQCIVSDNIIDNLNAQDSTKDCRAIYVVCGTSDENRDIAILRNRISNLTAATASRERTIHINTTAAFDGLVVADNEMIDVGYPMYSTNVSNVTSFQLLRNQAWSYVTTYTLGTLATDAVIEGNLAGGIPVFVAATATSTDATPSVRGLKTLTTANASSTTITALDDGVAGQTVTVLINDANTTIDFTGTTLKGNGGVDWTPASGDHMTCTKIGSNWYCTVSDNTA